MKNTCLIISGGEYCDVPQEVKNGAAYAIACDSGYRHAERMGIRPDRIIGDFDSAPVPETDIPVDRAPTHKDDTDTMLAVRCALEEGWRDIVICCAFGGRMDHAFANIQTGTYVAARGGRTRMLGRDTDLMIFSGSEDVDLMDVDAKGVEAKGESAKAAEARVDDAKNAAAKAEGAGMIRIPRRDGWSLSVFALSDQCTGITIRGTKYECTDATFSNTFCLGVSNVWAADTAVIQVRRGIIMVMLSRLKAGEHI